MKQTITITCAILALALLLAGCEKVATENSENSKRSMFDIPIIKYMDYQSYDGVISEFRKYVNLVDEVDFDTAREADVFLEPKHGYKSYEWGCMRDPIAMSDFEEHPENRYKYGYAIKDINGNGTEELILLYKDGSIMAIITNFDENVILIDAFWSRYRCYIDREGYIITQGGHQAIKWQLSEYDSELIFIDGYDASYEPPRHILSKDGKEYKTFNHENEYKEFRDFRDSFIPDEIENATDCSVYGLDFTPLFQE